MRYFGSKSSVVKAIFDLVAAQIPSGLLCDAFGGIGIVGAYFKKNGYQVSCGDILTFAHFFQIARVELNVLPDFRDLKEALSLSSTSGVVDFLNEEHMHDDWFMMEYARKRHFFTVPNAERIGSCRMFINQWSRSGWLSRSERALLLASLINSMDKVANTAGTYYAYLKSWYRKAVQPFKFELLPVTSGTCQSQSFLSDAKHLVGSRSYDILYLDPPYNRRCYGKYYHLPESLCHNETPCVGWKSGIPTCPRPTSAFNKRAFALKELEQLLEMARFRLLVFHYADSGLISPTELRYLLCHFGETKEFTVETKAYSTKSRCRKALHRIYMVSHV